LSHKGKGKGRRGGKLSFPPLHIPTFLRREEKDGKRGGRVVPVARHLGGGGGRKKKGEGSLLSTSNLFLKGRKKKKKGEKTVQGTHPRKGKGSLTTSHCLFSLEEGEGEEERGKKSRAPVPTEYAGKKRRGETTFFSSNREKKEKRKEKKKGTLGTTKKKKRTRSNRSRPICDWL